MLGGGDPKWPVNSPYDLPVRIPVWNERYAKPNQNTWKGMTTGMVWIVFKDLNGSSRFKGFQHTRITIHTIIHVTRYVPP